MKKMKKFMKQLMASAFVCAMVIALLPATVQAKTTKKSITLYKGEAIYYTDYSTVKSVKSSNSKVAKASKDKSADYKTNIVAKKAGKTNVTIRTKSGNAVVAVTVKNAKFTSKIESVNESGYVLISVKNNSKDVFDSIEMTYTIKDSNGGVIAQKSEKMNSILPNKTAYTNVYIGSDNMENLSLSQSLAKVTGYSRSWIGYTYKDVSSKITCTPQVTEETDSGISYNMKLKNSYNDSVSGKVYTMVYDADNNLLGVESNSINLDKKETKTVTYGYVSKRAYPNYDHMKLVVQAYAIERAKNF